jgi:hypothetical protein
LWQRGMVIVRYWWHFCTDQSLIFRCCSCVFRQWCFDHGVDAAGSQTVNYKRQRVDSRQQTTERRRTWLFIQQPRDPCPAKAGPVWVQLPVSVQLHVSRVERHVADHAIEVRPFFLEYLGCNRLISRCTRGLREAAVYMLLCAVEYFREFWYCIVSFILRIYHIDGTKFLSKV